MSDSLYDLDFLLSYRLGFFVPGFSIQSQQESLHPENLLTQSQ